MSDYEQRKMFSWNSGFNDGYRGLSKNPIGYPGWYDLGYEEGKGKRINIDSIEIKKPSFDSSDFFNNKK